MTPNCLLNIFIYACRQMVLSALVREVTPSNEWQWMQKLIVAKASKNKWLSVSPIPPNLGLREHCGREDGKNARRQRMVAKYCLLDMIQPLQSQYHNRWGCLCWALTRLILPLVSHWWRKGSWDPTLSCQAIGYWWILGKGQSLSSVMSPWVSPAGANSKHMVNQTT